MELNPRTLQVLADLKKDLLSREAPAPEPEKPREEKEEKSLTFPPRHARTRNCGFQHYMRTGGW